MKFLTIIRDKFDHKANEVNIGIILGSSYIFCSLIGNISATKVTYLGNLVMDAGFIYALTFTIRDLIHKNLGKQIALTTIWLSGVLNVIAVLYFQLVLVLPAESSWLESGGQRAWEFIFGLQMRIFIASVLVQIIAELIDTHIYQKWTNGIGAKLPQWTRVVVSNSISIPVDSILFPILAFSGIVSTISLWQMFYTNIIIKAIMTGGFFWLIYVVPTNMIKSNKQKKGDRVRVTSTR